MGLKGKRNRRPVVWITRDPDSALASYNLHFKEPKEKGITHTDFDMTWCDKEFERATAFRLPLGGCKRVRIRIEGVR